MLRLRQGTYLGFMIGIFGVLLSLIPSVNEIEEDSGLGMLLNLRGPRKPPSETVVVSIDKESSESLKVLGNPARWHRSVHAQLI